MMPQPMPIRLPGWGDDGTKELFCRLLEQTPQELMDAALTAQIGASPVRCEGPVAVTTADRSRVAHRPDPADRLGILGRFRSAVGSCRTQDGARRPGALHRGWSAYVPWQHRWHFRVPTPQPQDAQSVDRTGSRRPTVVTTRFVKPRLPVRGRLSSGPSLPGRAQDAFH